MEGVRWQMLVHMKISKLIDHGPHRTVSVSFSCSLEVALTLCNITKPLNMVREHFATFLFIVALYRCRSIALEPV